MKLFEATIGDIEAGAERTALTRVDSHDEWDPGEDKGYLEHVAYLEAWGRWADEIDQDRERSVDEDAMWVDPRIEELAA